MIMSPLWEAEFKGGQDYVTEEISMKQSFQAVGWALLAALTRFTERGQKSELKTSNLYLKGMHLKFTQEAVTAEEIGTIKKNEVLCTGTKVKVP